jgi:hypothetical protein
MMIYESDCSTIDPIKLTLKSRFQVTNLGKVYWLLSIQIELDNIPITLSHIAYIDTILSNFQLEQNHLDNLSINPNEKLWKYKGIDNLARTKLYQQIIGSLMYCVTRI